ncbi:hypothetical protein DRJ22_05445 [Candidatus Woesearchaeota archaeon]|nr:MAG: hypothetical protein DRJ22_05445 [Candidatus Woesearchaeota archaeon]
MNPIFLAVLLSLTPFGELRAGLPVAVVSGVPVWLALFVLLLIFWLFLFCFSFWSLFVLLSLLRTGLLGLGFCDIIFSG